MGGAADQAARCGRGGTGRRAGLKIRFRKECRFDSDRPHHLLTALDLTALDAWPRPLARDGHGHAASIAWAVAAVMRALSSAASWPT